MTPEEPLDKDAKRLFDETNEDLRKIDESTEMDFDLWDQYRPIYHGKELQNSKGEAIGQIYVERSRNDTLRIKCLFGSKNYPFTPTIFKKWVEEEGFQVCEPSNT